MKPIKLIPAFIGLLMCMTSRLPAQEIQVTDSEKITVGPGPEDMVLDTLSGPPRLLISCTGRREEHKPYGEIEALDLRKGERVILERKGEPAGIRFRPHGIYLDKDLLYVISHEREPDYHPILVYRVGVSSLKFEELIHTPFQHSPNALVTGGKGEIYLVNDSGKRGSLMEKALKLKRANLVRLEKNQEGVWIPAVVAEKLGYPAGINRIGDKLYVGDAILGKVHVYKIVKDGLEPAGSLEDMKGNDNIRIHEGKILCPGHVKPMKFVGHAKKSGKLSPVAVYLADPETGRREILYENGGEVISGASSAILFGDQLYLCQVFEPFVLKIGLKTGD